jgi:hypothetical protein
MEKGVVKLVIFNGEDFGYWKNQTRNYLLSQGRGPLMLWSFIATMTHDHYSDRPNYTRCYSKIGLCGYSADS